MLGRKTPTWVKVAEGAAFALALRRSVGGKLYRMRGKVALITGGTRGLGLELARAFGEQGAKVAICGRDPAALEHARQTLVEAGIDVLAWPCDVREKSQVDELVEAVLRFFGRVDILVNNAGTIQMGPMETMKLADYEEAMRTHYWGPLFAIQACIPHMKALNGGRIVNITSIGGRIAVPHLLPYSGSKFALVGLSDGLRAELARSGIRVTTVCPGLMRTGSPRHAFFKGNARAEYAWFILGDSLPGASISSRRAARKIVAACRRGDAELIVGAQANLAIKARTMFPEVFAVALDWTNRLLPRPPSGDGHRVTGAEVESPVTRSPLTWLTRRAEARNNQLV